MHPISEAEAERVEGGVAGVVYLGPPVQPNNGVVYLGPPAGYMENLLYP
jgi:hypothetical protein